MHGHGLAYLKGTWVGFPGAEVTFDPVQVAARRVEQRARLAVLLEPSPTSSAGRLGFGLPA